MSAIAVGGRRYAAGLYWLGRGGARATARTARRLGRPWCVHHGERTGFAAGEAAESPEGAGPAGLGPAGPGPEGLPALALALLDHVESEFWMALVEGGAPGGTGRYALVKARDGAVLADGDEVFGDRAAALAAFERARALGWALHASPGVMAELDGGAGGVTPLDIGALDEAAARAGAEIALVRAAAARRPVGRLAGAALGLTVLLVLAAGWSQRDALLAWLAAPEPIPAPAASLPEPRVDVAVDSAALIAACRWALIENPPFLPAWRIERIDCAARFAEPELTGLRPELAGRPVLLVRWRLASGHAEAMHRRLAEKHLALWDAASVADGRAWAAVALAPVLRTAETAAPPFLALRRAVDRAFGARRARIGYARGAEGGWTVRIEDSGPLSRLGPLAGGIAGLEITALSRGAGGGWRLEGRPVAPERLAASRLRALGVNPDAGEAFGAGSTDGSEVQDGTQRHDGM